MERNAGIASVFRHDGCHIFVGNGSRTSGRPYGSAFPDSCRFRLYRTQPDYCGTHKQLVAGNVCDRRFDGYRIHVIHGKLCGDILIFILSFLLPNPAKYPELLVAAEDGASADHSKYKNSCTTLGQIAAKKETWILLAMFACSGMSGQMLTSQLNNIAQVHVGLASGASLIMALGLCNGLGRLLVSGVSDRIGVCNTYRILYCGIAASMVLMIFANGFGLMLLAVVLLGLFYGGGTALIWAADTMVFGKQYVGSVNGIVTNGFAVAALIGPSLASHFVDTTGGYVGAFVAVIAFAALGIVLSFGIRDNYDAA